MSFCFKFIEHMCASNYFNIKVWQSYWKYKMVQIFASQCTCRCAIKKTTVPMQCIC